MVCDMLVDRRRRDPRLPVLPGGDRSAMRASPTPRWRRSSPTRAARRRAQRKELVPHLLNLHDVYRALLKAARQARRGRLRDHRDADRLRRQRPHREDRAAHAQRGAPADRGGDAGGQRLLRPTSSPQASTRRCTACTKARRPRRRTLLQQLPEGARPRPVDQRRPEAGRVPGDRRGHQGPARRAADPHDAAALDAAGDLHAASTAATSAWPTRPTRTSPARSGAIPTCWCTA